MKILYTALVASSVIAFGGCTAPKQEQVSGVLAIPDPEVKMPPLLRQMGCGNDLMLHEARMVLEEREQQEFENEIERVKEQADEAQNNTSEGICR